MSPDWHRGFRPEEYGPRRGRRRLWLPYTDFAFALPCLVTAIAVLWFKIPTRGSIVLLLGLTFVYLLMSVGIGLLISTISSTQQETMPSTFLLFLPANLLSGLIFLVQNKCTVIQQVTFLNPLWYYMVIPRGVLLN